MSEKSAKPLQCLQNGQAQIPCILEPCTGRAGPHPQRAGPPLYGPPFIYARTVLELIRC